MKILKKLTASALAVAILAGTTACGAIGGDKSWAVKNDNLTVPIGGYICYLYDAYQIAASKVPDTAKPVLDQKIEGKDATQWIKDTALLHTNSLLVMNDKMKELKLSLTPAETQKIESATDQQWGSVSTTLEKCGVAKSSYNLVASDYSAKYEKVFTALYGKGGKKEMKDADLKTFFEKNYTDFSYIAVPLTSATTNATMSDADKKKIKTELDGYVADVKAGKKTMQQVGDAYKASSKQETDPLQNATEDFTNAASYPAGFVTTLASMKAGEVKVAEISGYYVLVQKNDISKKTAEHLAADSTTRTAVIQDAFSKEIDGLAKNLKGAQVNQKAIDSYQPKMFVEKKSAKTAQG